MHRPLTTAAVLGAALAAWALGCSGAKSVDAGCVSNTPLGACKPDPCATGNELNIGAYCTSGGGQCRNYSNRNLVCAADLPQGAGVNFCATIGCHTNADCGSAACCTGNSTGPQIYGCAPIECVATDDGGCPPPPNQQTDAGSDGGTDAGLDGGDGG